MIALAWLVLFLAVAVLLLGLAVITPPPGARYLPIVAAILGGVVLILAIVRIAD
jgi:hypothetical protein